MWELIVIEMPSPATTIILVTCNWEPLGGTDFAGLTLNLVRSRIGNNWRRPESNVGIDQIKNASPEVVDF